MCVLSVVPCITTQLHATGALSDITQGPSSGTSVWKRADLAVSMDGLLRFLGEFHNDAIADSMLVGLVRMYGLGFKLSPGDMERLRTAGASDSLVEALETAPVNIIAPPRPPTGFLSVLCQPLDCEVEVNGRRIGLTSQGSLGAVALPVGEARVRAIRENYETDRSEETVSVVSGTTTNLLFHLTLSRRAIEAEGARIFGRVLGALGTDILSSQSETLIRAAGVLEIKTRNATPTTWSAVISISTTGIARFQLARGGRKCDLTLRKSEVLWKKRPEDREIRQLEEAARFIMSYQLISLIQRVNNPSFRILAGITRSAELDPSSVRAKTDNETYVISVDSSHRPTEVLLESAGLNGGTQVLYSRYADLGGLVYPQETEVVGAGGTEGVAIRFDRIDRTSRGKGLRKRARPLHGLLRIHAESFGGVEPIVVVRALSEPEDQIPRTATTKPIEGDIRLAANPVAHAARGGGPVPDQ